ncbi:hypothetical protein CDAR_291191 [Caerostris darwini]|uniref:Uncharacterized protein n=1 Tax=Caerostris darwini TaxID=1538125 RepID=A0AAV4RP05_9ARAC|nr:hypothetical protein CDAR_291191 [Caerostris darwini]
MTSAVKNGIERFKKNTTSGVGGGTNTSSLTSLPPSRSFAASSAAVGARVPPPAWPRGVGAPARVPPRRGHRLVGRQ